MKSVFNALNLVANLHSYMSPSETVQADDRLKLNRSIGYVRYASERRAVRELSRP